MRVRHLGESCLLIDHFPLRLPARLASLLNADLPTGIEEVVAAYDTIALYGDPQPGWEDWVQGHIEQLQSDNSIIARQHRIPVCYGMGMDLESTAQLLSLSEAELVRIHSETKYLCYAVGFSPGFAYLGHLPERIAGVPRLPEPRVKVPAGSLGITESQTAVYPDATPGGWRLVGRCPLTLVDVGDNYFPIEPGDEVKFVPISTEEFVALEGERL